MDNVTTFHISDTAEKQISLYAILNGQKQFLQRFDSQAQKAIFTSEPIEAKLFSNKYDIKLRPDESIVEYVITINGKNVDLKTPFRPKKRVTTPAEAAATKV